MKTELKLRHEIVPSFAVDKVRGMFDLEIDAVEKRIPVDLPFPDDWKIGAIIGPSGTGKTTIARQCFPGSIYFEGFPWTEHDAVIDAFKTPVQQATEILGKVGFASPPDWLKPYRLLSNGEKMRVDLARLLTSYPDKAVLYDEFTSVVDRQVATFGCAAVEKFIRRSGGQFIAVTCHSDIVDWLQPDWVYDTKTYTFSNRGRLRRPDIEISIREGARGEWRLFSDYHYLTAKLPRMAKNYLAEINGDPVAWCSVIHYPHPTRKNIRKLVRTVVRPDYQGLGIGGWFSTWVAQRYLDQGFAVFATLSNPALVAWRNRDPRWKLTRKGRITYSRSGQLKTRRSSENRLTATFEYVGNAART